MAFQSLPRVRSLLANACAEEELTSRFSTTVERISRQSVFLMVGVDALLVVVRDLHAAVVADGELLVVVHAGVHVLLRASLDELAAGEGRLVATGGGTVLREHNRAVLRARGFVVYLRASIAQQMARLARDRKRPLLQGPDKRQKLEQLAREREPLYLEVADFEAGGADLTPNHAAQRLAVELEQRWQRAPATQPA